MKNKIIQLTALIICMSCTTKTVKSLSFFDSPELVESFDLKDKSFSKFKTNDLQEEDELIVAKVIASKKMNKDKKHKVHFSKRKKVSLKNVPPLVSKKTYPDDYPEVMKKYDKESIKVWDKFSPFFFPKEKFVLQIKYLGITAGYATLETLKPVKVANKPAFHFKARLQSARFYQYIYSLDDSIETFVTAREFLPIKYTLLQRESSQTVDDLQIFDHEKLKTFFWYKKIKKGRETKKNKEVYVPKFFQDSFSSLYFVRGLPLKVGNSYEFPVVTRGKIWKFNMLVEKIENIKVMGESVRAYKIKAETKFPGVLKKKGDITFWYSADKYRKILRFRAKIKIGAVEGNLVNYTKGDKRFSKAEHQIFLKTGPQI